jgi:hypothetical protein
MIIRTKAHPLLIAPVSMDNEKRRFSRRLSVENSRPTSVLMKNYFQRQCPQTKADNETQLDPFSAPHFSTRHGADCPREDAKAADNYVLEFMNTRSG